MKTIPFLLSLCLAATLFAETQVSDVVSLNLFENQPNMLEQLAPGAYEQGFTRDGDTFCVEAESAAQKCGVFYGIRLNQTVPAPIYFEAESRAEGVLSTRSSDYSIYLDLTYMDGTHEWGVTAPFAGKPDWEKRSRVFVPSKPIRNLSMYLIFRNRTGKAWFRNPRFVQAQLPSGADFFQLDGLSGVLNPEVQKQLTGDGFHFYLRDEAADSGWILMEPQCKPGVLAARGIEVQLDGDAFTVRNNTSGDRSVRLLAAWNVQGAARYCFPMLDETPEITSDGAGEFSYKAPAGVGAGSISRLPLIGAATDDAEQYLALDPQTPAVFRLLYNVKLNQLCAVFDLAFIPEKREWTLRLARFTQPAGLGMRAAWQHYMELYPAAFAVHLPRDPETGRTKMGVWMPFEKISKVQNYQDFGFRFKEGNDETRWDDAHDILTYHYTEPMTWWMSLPAEAVQPGEDVIAAGVRAVKELAKKNHAYALAWENSVMYDQDQRPAGLYLDTPWCKGIVWSMNAVPGIPQPSDFAAKWNENHIRWAYEMPEENGDMDGEYIDSSEGYVTIERNYRRDQMPYVTTPLTFDPETKAPVIFRGLTTFEYIRAISGDVRGRGKSMMANSTPHQLFWLAPLLDILGTEINWNYGNRWSPMGAQSLLWRRMLCGKKPYCFLMNTKFDDFTYECSEKFMKRSLAFGMFPGYFSADASTGHYFTRPELYDRDRPLFKKYIPLCQLLAEAGWEPVTRAQSSDPEIHVERFGAGYFTVFNLSQTETKTFTLTFGGLCNNQNPNLLLGAQPVNGEWTLAPEDVMVIEFK